MYSNSQPDLITTKLELILESPTEREKYKKLVSDTEKIDFLSGHFIMDDMTVRLIKRRYLLSNDSKRDFVSMIEDMIRKLEG